MRALFLPSIVPDTGFAGVKWEVKDGCCHEAYIQSLYPASFSCSSPMTHHFNYSVFNILTSLLIVFSIIYWHKSKPRRLPPPPFPAYSPQWLTISWRKSHNCADKCHNKFMVSPTAKGPSPLPRNPFFSVFLALFLDSLVLISNKQAY